MDDNNHNGHITDDEGEGRFGHMTEPDDVENETALEGAQELGIYEDADEEHPKELNIAEEISKNRDT